MFLGLLGLDFGIQSLDWTDEFTLSLILFAAGLLCIVCAIFLAIYLLKSDRFSSKPKKESELPLYPSLKEIEGESRPSQLKSRISSFFGRVKRAFKRSDDDYELYEDESSKSSSKFTYSPPEKFSEEESFTPIHDVKEEPIENEADFSPDDDIP
jgi:hypothetical protein